MSFGPNNTPDTSRWTSQRVLISGSPSTPSELAINYVLCPPPNSTSSSKGTILLIHGYPQTSHQFRHVITPLSDAGYTVIAPDYRGAGHSSKPRTGYTKSSMAADLHTLITSHLGIKSPIHVVGHDIGGMVAHAYATRFASSVSSVTFGECPLPGSTVYDNVFLKSNLPGLWHFHFHNQTDLPELLTKGKEREYISHFYDRLCLNASAITDADVDVYARSFERAGAMRAGFDVYRAFAEDAEENKKWLEKEGKCKVPCLGLDGEGSFLKEVSKEQIKEMYVDARSETVEASGHWCAEENPQDFVKKVLAWVGKHGTEKK